MPKLRRRRHRIQQAPLERIEKGEGGERALQDWLDRSRLAYLFLDQTPLTIPASFRADLKRPDFLVAVEDHAPVAVDAKAKAFLAGHFVIDASERRRLDGFEARFGMPVWYACFPPNDPGLCYHFRNRALMGNAVVYDREHELIHAPVALGHAAHFIRQSFAAALAQATRHSTALSRCAHVHLT
jgi:hypothetical protein